MNINKREEPYRTCRRPESIEGVAAPSMLCLVLHGGGRQQSSREPGNNISIVWPATAERARIRIPDDVELIRRRLEIET